MKQGGSQKLGELSTTVQRSGKAKTTVENDEFDVINVEPDGTYEREQRL